jgi:prepilin peptidase CpaA
MRPITLLPLMPMLALLVWAAIEDHHVRKIRNWLTLSLAITGLIQPALGGAGISFGMSVCGLLTGFGLLFVLFAIGAVGGGDVKLLAGLGAWVGPWGVFQIFLAEAVIGAVLVVWQAGRQGKLGLLSKNSAVVAINLIHVRQVGLEHATETGKSIRTIDRPLPFAVPVLIAVIGLILAGKLPVR